MIVSVLGVFAVWLFVFAMSFAFAGDWKSFAALMALAGAVGVEIEARTP